MANRPANDEDDEPKAMLIQLPEPYNPDEDNHNMRDKRPDSEDSGDDFDD